MAPSRSLSLSRSPITISMNRLALFVTLALALSSTLTPVNCLTGINPNAPYSSADPNGPTQQNLIPYGNFANTGNGITDNTANFDAFIGNGFKTCLPVGSSLNTLCEGPLSAEPWTFPSVNTFVDYTGQPLTNLLEYRRTPAVSASGTVYPYGEVSLRFDTTLYEPGTVLNFQVHVSQLYEAGTNETHYVLMDFYSGTYNPLYWGINSFGTAANSFRNGYFDPTNFINGATTTAPTFLFRDVIMAEPAASYPSYTNINRNRPLPASATFAILRYGVSSGPFTSTHPTSLFDVRLYARPLATGPTVVAYYDGPSPAGQTARVYFATTQCLQAGNFTTGQIQIQSANVNATITNFQLVSSGAEQLYALDLSFPTGVSGPVTIQVPGQSLFNYFNLSNAASNTLTLNVLTQLPHLTIYSPNYPVFPATQQNTTIQYTFSFDTDVYGFDITRVGLCQTEFENDTCTNSQYIYVTPGTNTWTFPNNDTAVGSFSPDSINPTKTYYLILSDLPDATYRALVLGTGVLSAASQNMPTDVTSQAPIRVDTTAPVISFVPIANTYAHLDNQLVFNVTFSEEVTGLNITQLNVTNGVVASITAITSAPNSLDPQSTWCYSTTSSPCFSKYVVQVNHSGAVIREAVVLSYFSSPSSTSQQIFDLAGNPLNTTGGTFPAVPDGVILFSNQNTAVSVYPYPADLLSGSFVGGATGNKTNLQVVRYNFSFDYPVPSFNAAAQFAANNLTFTTNPTATGMSWSATTQLDNFTFTANLTLPASTPTTNLTTTLLAGSVIDVAGDTNSQSNTDILLFDTRAPICQNVTYGSQERFATHESLTNATTLTYTFSFDEPISNFAGATPFFANFTPTLASPVSSIAVSGSQVIYTLNTNKATDDTLGISVALVNVTDLFDNTQFSFGSCQAANFTLDYTSPNATFITSLTPFATNSTNDLFVAPRHSAFITKSSNVTITYEFSEYVNLVQSALQFQYEAKDTSLTTVNQQIVGFVPYDCAPAPFNAYCLHFNVTVTGQDTSYSILQFNPSLTWNVTDLAGNPVNNNPVYYYLTDQTPPAVVLSASYPIVNGVYRSNSQNVTISLTFSKHIERFPGTMYGNCSNSTNSIILTNVTLVFVGTDQTSRINFTATFDVSQADRMTCQFYIGPGAVFDTVGNTLNGTTSIIVATRFSAPHVTVLSSPRGWLTNDLNPIPVCLTTDTAIDVSNLFGAGGANNLTANIAENSTVPAITDFITGRNIQTTNRTYNATSLTFCANLLPITSDTDIRVVIPLGSIVDIYNNTNIDAYNLRIQRFDLNPDTYDNLVKDGIITNAKLANGSITNRNLDTGSVDQRALANFSVGTPQLQPGAVETIDIADYAVNSAEIAPGAINATHLSNNSVQTAAINDSAITNGKLAANAVTTDKILDGTIQTQDLANASITIDKIANNSVDTNRIVDGAITTSKIANNSIVNSQLTANSVSTIDLMDRNVTQTKIAIGAVGSNELANNSVLLQHMTNGSVNSAVILDGSIEQIDLDFNSVGTPELIDGNVTNSKLGADAVTTDKILDGTILNQDLSNNSISNLNIMPFTVQWNNMANNSVDQYNLVTGSVTSRSIANVSVLNQHLTDSSVDHRVIAPQSIDSSKIIPRSIQAESLAPNVVATLNYQNGSILNQFIAPNAINNSQIQPGAVDTNSIAAEAVQNAQLGSHVVTGDKIAAATISLSNMDSAFALQLQAIADSVNIPRPIAGSLINDYSLVGTKLANKTVSTQQLGDSSVTVDKIAENAVTWAQIAPQTINADNLGNSAVLSRAIAPLQIQPYHLSSDFFLNIPQSIDASQSIKPNTITESLLADGSVSIGKLTASSFASLVDMFHRLALLEATVTALVNNIDSRCIFNTTFTIPPAATTALNTSSHATIEHTMKTMHPEIQAEIKRRSFHAEAVTALGVQPGSSQKYPLNIQSGTPYCADGAGAPAGNTTGGSSNNNGVVINGGVSVSPSSLFVAVIAAIVAMLTL